MNRIGPRSHPAHSPASQNLRPHDPAFWSHRESPILTAMNPAPTNAGSHTALARLSALAARPGGTEDASTAALTARFHALRGEA
jgi:hypothetical protein